MSWLDNISLIARCKETNEIAGCILNTIWHRDEQENPTQTPEDLEFRSTRPSILAFGGMLNDLHNSFWDLRPNDEEVAIHCEIVSVGKNHQRQGIASTFMNWLEQVELLTSVNASGIVAEASSLANQTLLARRGYTTLKSTSLAEKVDPDTGKPYIVCDDGTDRINLMFKKF